MPPHLNSDPLVIDGVTYVATGEICQRLHLARQTLWRWRRTGRVPSGRRWRDKQIVFSPAEVEQILRYAHKLEPAAVSVTGNAEHTKEGSEP